MEEKFREGSLLPADTKHKLDTSLHSQAAFWSKKVTLNFINPVNMEKVLEFIPDKKAKILEYGCGYGRVLNTLAEKGYLDLHGIDFSPEMIKRGQREYTGINLYLNDGKKIPFNDSEFDAVFLFTVLTCIHQTETQEEIVSEIKRVLKEDGIIYISDFLLSNDDRNLKRYSDNQEKYNCYGVFELDGGGICRHHTLEYIKNLFSDFEFKWFIDSGIQTLSGNPAQPFQIIANYMKEKTNSHKMVC